MVWSLSSEVVRSERRAASSDDACDGWIGDTVRSEAVVMVARKVRREEDASRAVTCLGAG